MVIHVWNPTQHIREAEAKGLPGQPRLHRDYQVSQDYILKLCVRRLIGLVRSLSG